MTPVEALERQVVSDGAWLDYLDRTGQFAEYDRCFALYEEKLDRLRALEREASETP